MDLAIRLLDENIPHGINVVFNIDADLPTILMRLYDENYRDYHGFVHDLRDLDQCDQLGKAIGRSTSLCRLNLQGEIYTGNRNNRSNQSIEAIYRGLEINSSLEQLSIDVSHLLDEVTLPTLNIHDVQCKITLKDLELIGNISEHQSQAISSFIENFSLERFCMASIDVGDRREEISESALSRVILACTKVKKFKVFCESASQYDALASLLANPRSILSEIDFCGEFDKAEGLSTIAAGLASNTTLEILRSWGYGVVLSPMAKALCDASSIEGICASNHTLRKMITRDSETMPTLPKMIKDCLELNKNANKEEVIRKKISRYYFMGNFDTSPFANMPVSVLPEVFNLIDGDIIYQQSAMFRMLETIPELCNVSSRDAKYDGDKVGSGSTSNKRPKINND